MKILNENLTPAKICIHNGILIIDFNKNNNGLISGGIIFSHVIYNRRNSAECIFVDAYNIWSDICEIKKHKIDLTKESLLFLSERIESTNYLILNKIN